jgi:DUF1680 family protein
LLGEIVAWDSGQVLVRLFWTTVDRAFEYVAMTRDKTDDPVIKKNADKTIAALKRLRGDRGNACAC